MRGWEVLEQNMDTVENVRLRDWEPLLDSYRQLHVMDRLEILLEDLVGSQ